MGSSCDIWTLAFRFCPTKSQAVAYYKQLLDLRCEGKSTVALVKNGAFLEGSNVQDGLGGCMDDVTFQKIESIILGNQQIGPKQPVR